MKKENYNFSIEKPNFENGKVYLVENVQLFKYFNLDDYAFVHVYLCEKDGEMKSILLHDRIRQEYAKLNKVEKENFRFLVGKDWETLNYRNALKFLQKMGNDIPTVGVVLRETLDEELILDATHALVAELVDLAEE